MGGWMPKETHTVMIESRRTGDSSWSSTQSTAATGPGFARPVVSSKMWSNLHHTTLLLINKNQFKKKKHCTKLEIEKKNPVLKLEENYVWIATESPTHWWSLNLPLKCSSVREADRDRDRDHLGGERHRERRAYFSLRWRSCSIACRKLCLTLQQTQPLANSTHSSTRDPPAPSFTMAFSMPSSSPNSFRITAILAPWCSCNMKFTSCCFVIHYPPSKTTLSSIHRRSSPPHRTASKAHLKDQIQKSKKSKKSKTIKKDLR